MGIYEYLLCARQCASIGKWRWMRLLAPGGLRLAWALFSAHTRCHITQLCFFKKQSLSTCHVPGTVLGTGDSEMMKGHFCPSTCQGDRHANNYSKTRQKIRPK